MERIKTYMLDSSVLVHDPNAIFAFEENRLVIPTLAIKTLHELSGKTGERGASARDALRKLMSLFGDPYALEHSISTVDDMVAFEAAVAAEAGSGDNEELDMLLGDNIETMVTKTLETNGSVSIVYSGDEPDILNIAKMHGAILVTKDICVRLQAISRGIDAQDYLHDRAADIDRFYTGRSIVYLPSKTVSLVASGNPVRLDEPVLIYGIDEKTGAEVERDPEYKLAENEFLVVKNADAPQGGGCLARFTNGSIVKLRYDDSSPFSITPRNVGQRFAIEALLAPAEEVPLVILRGPAGTAKTFLAVACGLEKTYNQSEYKSVLVTRQSSLLDESPGFLPGTEQEKVSPLLRSVFDNINALMPNANTGRKDGKNCGPEDELISRGILQVQAMTFMRGRSIANTYIILDEAQNATPSQLLAIISRAAEHTKVVLTGDILQIDNPYLDKHSNGLTFVSEKMRGSPLCCQVAFQDDECERSPLANEAIHRLASSGS